MYPDVELSLEVANSEDIEASIHDTTLDIGLIEGPLIGKDLESIPFLTDHLQLITSTNHPWANLDTISTGKLVFLQVDCVQQSCFCFVLHSPFGQDGDSQAAFYGSFNGRGTA